MRFLIRKLIRTATGSTEYQDLEIIDDVLTIGRAADQLLYLPGYQVALSHAAITRKGDGYSISANGAAEISVNDRAVRSLSLRLGDKVSIGPHQLYVIKTPAGFDFALEVIESEAEEKQGVSAIAASSTKLSGSGVSKRLIGWISVLVVLIIGGVIPLIGSLSPDLHRDMKKVGLGSAEFWSSGPLASVHQNSKAVFDCHACHAKPFEPVQNAQCLECHKTVGNHIHSDSPAHQAVGDLKCGSCHQEHQEPAKLVRVEQKLCVDCHGDIAKLDGKTEIRNVHDFAKDHPAFKARTFVLEGTEWKTQRELLSKLKNNEQSNLKFNHKVHLKPEGILTPNGSQVLQCDTCHQLDEAGRYMKPMTMEKTCRSCHALTFDERDPDRQVPHGDPDAVITSLQEYYLRKFTEAPKQQEAPTAAEMRRGRPGHEREKPFICTKSPLQCAQEATQKTAQDLFERTACYNCHEVNPATDKKAISPYVVKPVKITSQWMTGAKFSHADHMTEGCDKCHAAAQSETSKDVLIPDIDNCQQCHGGEHTFGKLKSMCIDCHDFHFKDRGGFRDLLPQAKDRSVQIPIINPTSAIQSHEQLKTVAPATDPQ